MQKNQIYLIVSAAVIVIIAAAAAVVVIGDDDDDNDEKNNTTSGYTKMWIIGNANLDNYVNADDVEYIQGIIDGKNPVKHFVGEISGNKIDVNMADVNCDGVVDSKDVEKLQSMISATADSPKQVIYYVDVDGNVNSMHFPAVTLISTYEQNSKQLQTIDAMDMIIAWDYQSAAHIYASQWASGDNAIPVIFNSYDERKDPDAELIERYAPDAVLTGTSSIYCQNLEVSLPSNRENMDIIRISSWEDDNVIEGTLTLGFMILKNAEAQAYADWAQGWFDTISDKVSTLSDDEIVNVLCPRGSYNDWNVTFNGPRSGKYETSLLAGANNIITRNLTSTSTNIVVNDEWVKTQSDLDWIVAIVYGDLDNASRTVTSDPSGSSVTYTNKSFFDTATSYWSGMTEQYGTKVAVVDNLVSQGTTYVIGAVYMAKWFYPTLFQDMDPDAIFSEFLTKFFNYDYDQSAYYTDGGSIAIGPASTNSSVTGYAEISVLGNAELGDSQVDGTSSVKGIIGDALCGAYPSRFQSCIYGVPLSDGSGVFAKVSQV